MDSIERPNPNEWFHGSKSFYENGRCMAACYDQQNACKGYAPPVSDLRPICWHHDYDTDRCYSEEMKQKDKYKIEQIIQQGI